MTIRLTVGKVCKVVRLIATNSLDGGLCDPPYGLNLLGKDWDKAVPPVEDWDEIHRVLKPGAYLLAFGGSRTHDILVGSLRRVGFEIRDSLAWLHSNGFLGGQDISKAVNRRLGEAENDADAKSWDGYGTRLKPAWEPIILAQKSLDGNYVDNALTWGVGGMNLGDCMIPASDKPRFPNGEYVNPGLFGVGAHRDGDRHPDARFPSNVLMTHHPDCHGDQCYPDCPIRLLNEQAGAEVSRFYYCSRATTKERNLGLDAEVNNHPCVKPLQVCEYLAKLILPPDQGKPRTILVPYAGSGSEMVGSLLAGWDGIYGIELDPQYVEIAKQRVLYWKNTLDGRAG